MARRYDPDRRQRIIDAAIRVVGKKGIGGLSHRSVAAEADVPLGSTTYHFKTLDDLMVAALRQANEGFGKAVRERASLLAPDADLAAELAQLTGEWLGGDRTGVELEYELYLAALRRPALRPVAAEWCASVEEILVRRVDRVTARAVVALLDGICLQVLLTGGEFDEAYTREMLRRMLRESSGPGREGQSPRRTGS
ncbi:TetR family transcriptional regulator [Streptomyces sp. YC504]|uniref:TetR family transcriptional regulator n=1 Tax=Streptomyces mesophilus TaxID=1775132 RepID=A0A6G4XNQ9_9ACTN|nr:TetR family transcriptional regulator [Streptomyces mesophilus]NGO79068.1 TetR family transcriptional regulator [Streptomyces mesophilus]